MKLLLTSAGITNEVLANTLRKMVSDEIRIAFIPTAANVEAGEKDWLIDNFNECQELGPVDIVDISAVEKDIWLPRLQEASVIVVGGGNTSHLIKCMRQSGFAEEVTELLQTRVYVGISAGSIATGATLVTASNFLYDENEEDMIDGLGLVDIYVAPHLNSPYFEKAREKNLKMVANKVPGDFYALDDNSAVQIIDGVVKVVSTGKWLLFDKKQ